MLIWLTCAVVVTAAMVWVVKRFPQTPRLFDNALGALCIAVVLSPAYYEFPGVWFVPVTFDGGRTTVRPYGAFAWEWGGKFANLPREATTVFGEIKAITANPKVRELSYRLAVNISNLDRFYADPERRKLHPNYTVQEKGPYGTAFLYLGSRDDNILQRKVARITLDLLYRFNEAHSSQLGQFYNPLDAGQVEALKNIVEPWVNERLAPYGLRAAYQGFTIR